MEITIHERIETDVKVALKAGNAERVSVLRMLLSALHNERLARYSDLSEHQVVDVLQKEAKKRRDAANAFRRGGRIEQADAEEREQRIIQDYLPTDLSDGELTNIVRDVIAHTGSTSVRDIGRVMGESMKRIEGRADGTRVRDVVESMLS